MVSVIGYVKQNMLFNLDTNKICVATVSIEYYFENEAEQKRKRGKT